MQNNLVDKYFKVLDDGFIALKGFMGSDLDIERAARVSYGKGTRAVSDTRNLLRYLMRHRHTTPFEMGEMCFHIRAPIYVFRQWHRHRTWSYNEYSGRYSEMIDSTEVASNWRIQSTTNKQGSGSEALQWPENFEIPSDYLSEVDDATVSYTPQSFLSLEEKRLNDESRRIYEQRLSFGVAKEQARKDLPVSNYTEMYAKTDLKNLLGFMSLRCDSHAQLEIRLYANIIAGIVKELFPITFEAWYDYQFQGVNLSKMEISLLNYEMYLQNPENEVESDIDPLLLRAEHLGMSKREFEEYLEKTKIKPSQSFSLESYQIYNLPEQS